MMAQRVLFGGDSSANESNKNKRKKELDREEERMKTRYGENRRRDKGVPHACDCSAAIRVATSNDPNTRGELYFSCPYEISNGRGQGCGFRRWWIEALLDEFAKIKEEKNEMQKELAEAKKQIEKQDFSIFTMEIRRKALKNVSKETDGIVARLVAKIEDLEKKYEALEKKFDEP